MTVSLFGEGHAVDFRPVAQMQHDVEVVALGNEVVSVEESVRII